MAKGLSRPREPFDSSSSPYSVSVLSVQARSCTAVAPRLAILKRGYVFDPAMDGVCISGPGEFVCWRPLFVGQRRSQPFAADHRPSSFQQPARGKFQHRKVPGDRCRNHGEVVLCTRLGSRYSGIVPGGTSVETQVGYLEVHPKPAGKRAFLALRSCSEPQERGAREAVGRASFRPQGRTACSEAHDQ